MCEPETEAAGHERTDSHIPIKQCPYCGSEDLGSGWQQDQGLVTYKRSGLFGNPVRHIICRRCGGILYSQVLNAHRYPTV